MTLAGVPAGAGGKAEVKPDDLKTFLTYISSDELEGRNTFSEGLGLAAAYISDQLRSWGIQPGGDHGSYFERVTVLGVKVVDHSSVTVEVNGQSKTFKNGEGITLPRNVGGKRTFTVDQVEFLGWGLYAPAIKHNDYEGKSVKGKAVVFLGTAGPAGLDAASQRTMFGRGSSAIEENGAAAAIGPTIFRQGRGGRGGAAGATGATGQAAAPAGRGGGGRGALEEPDFTTVTRLDNPIPPSVGADDAFFEFLFSNSDVKYADLKDKASKRGELPNFTLKGVKLTFHLDADYRTVRTQYTRNVIGIIPGKDAKLKDTYVTFGAHYDHVGYAEGEVVVNSSGVKQRLGAVGPVTASAIDHRIWNGADDDGSGTATLLGIAKTFAKGPKTKRSLAFIWHAGEEKGLYGSRYNADYPAIPIEKTVANLNMDMIGRNDNDKPENANQVFLVGSDRISSELHSIVIDVNKKLAKPLNLDFAMNDPSDPERVYYRSDHYSYAAKGIPIIFFTTGLHPDYHHNTDTIEKILFDKMAHIGDLVYATGFRVANMDHAPERDNKGPRAGKDTK